MSALVTADGDLGVPFLKPADAHASLSKLDYNYFPHILENVVALADEEGLVLLYMTAVSSRNLPLSRKVKARLATHVALGTSSCRAVSMSLLMPVESGIIKTGKLNAPPIQPSYTTLMPKSPRDSLDFQSVDPDYPHQRRILDPLASVKILDLRAPLPSPLHDEYATSFPNLQVLRVGEQVQLFGHDLVSPETFRAHTRVHFLSTPQGGLGLGATGYTLTRARRIVLTWRLTGTEPGVGLPPSEAWWPIFHSWPGADAETPVDLAHAIAFPYTSPWWKRMRAWTRLASKMRDRPEMVLIFQRPSWPHDIRIHEFSAWLDDSKADVFLALKKRRACRNIMQCAGLGEECKCKERQAGVLRPELTAAAQWTPPGPGGKVTFSEQDLVLWNRYAMGLLPIESLMAPLQHWLMASPANITVVDAHLHAQAPMDSFRLRRLLYNRIALQPDGGLWHMLKCVRCVTSDEYMLEVGAEQWKLETVRGADF